MLMTRSIRKFALTIHVTSSVGWFGAVSAFLALAIAGVASSDVEAARSAYVAMPTVTQMVIVPFSVAALVTGIVQGLGTTWGLFRHRWIVAKLVLTVLATVLLIVHTQDVGRVATLATDRLLSGSDLRGLRIDLMAKAGAALVALVVATSLSVYKPWGLTRYGQQVVSGGNMQVDVQTRSRIWVILWYAALAAALTLFALLHLHRAMANG